MLPPSSVDVAPQGRDCVLEGTHLQFGRASRWWGAAGTPGKRPPGIEPGGLWLLAEAPSGGNRTRDHAPTSKKQRGAL